MAEIGDSVVKRIYNCIYLALIGKKMHIKRFVNLLSRHMKEKFPEVKMEFYLSK